MLNQRLGEIVPREKLFRLHVIRRSGARCDLFKVNGELARIERPAFTQFLTGKNDFILSGQGAGLSPQATKRLLATLAIFRNERQRLCTSAQSASAVKAGWSCFST